MSYTWLTDLDAALRAGGVPFVEVPASSADPTGAASWRTRGRPTSTGCFEPSGILCHHTASPAGTSPQADLNVILRGNSEAPGPISQLYVGRDAQLYLVAAGRANHGGRGRRPGIDGACADMNCLLLGIEAGNNGTGERWSDGMVHTYARTVAALCNWYEWNVGADVYLHATTGPPNGGCNSKIDPAGPWLKQPQLSGTWDLQTWRDYCATYLTPEPIPPQPPYPGDDDLMPMFINKGTYATFVMTGGFCHWIPDPQTADALGCPPPDANGFRGTWVSDEFLQNVVLIGAFPNPAGGLWLGHFRAWWPDGTPQSAQTAYPASAQGAAITRASSPPDG